MPTVEVAAKVEEEISYKSHRSEKSQIIVEKEEVNIPAKSSSLENRVVKDDSES